jgi:hypothetical protein
VDDPAAPDNDGSGSGGGGDGLEEPPVLTLAALQREYAIVRGHAALAAAMPGGRQGHATLGGGHGGGGGGEHLRGGDAEEVFAQLLALGERMRQAAGQPGELGLAQVPSCLPAAAPASRGLVAWCVCAPHVPTSPSLPPFYFPSQSPLAGLHDSAFQLAEAAFVGTQLTRALERAFASLAAACVTAQLARGRAAAACSAAAASSAEALLGDARETEESTGAGASAAASWHGASSSSGGGGGAVADWRRLKEWLRRCASEPLAGRLALQTLHRRGKLMHSSGAPCMPRLTPCCARCACHAVVQARGRGALLPPAPRHLGVHPAHRACIHAAAVAHGGVQGAQLAGCLAF